MFMLRLLSRPPVVATLLLSVRLSLPPSLFAQASNTASKSAGVLVFTGVEIVNPEYGPQTNAGVTFGGDFTRYLARLPLSVSFEARANFNRGPYVHQDSGLFGLRALYQYRRFGPYVDYLVGPGVVHYPLDAAYPRDNSVVYNYGGGLEVAFVRNVALKFDLQQQRWNTGTFRFTPVVGTIGLTYQIPFGRRGHGPGY